MCYFTMCSWCRHGGSTWCISFARHHADMERYVAGSIHRVVLARGNHVISSKYFSPPAVTAREKKVPAVFYWSIFNTCIPKNWVCYAMLTSWGRTGPYGVVGMVGGVGVLSPSCPRSFHTRNSNILATIVSQVPLDTLKFSWIHVFEHFYRLKTKTRSVKLAVQTTHVIDSATYHNLHVHSSARPNTIRGDLHIKITTTPSTNEPVKTSNEQNQHCHHKK